MDDLASDPDPATHDGRSEDTTGDFKAEAEYASRDPLATCPLCGTPAGAAAKADPATPAAGDLRGTADASEQCGPATADASEQYGPATADAAEQCGPATADAAEQCGPATADAEIQCGPAIADASEQCCPMTADASEQCGPETADAEAQCSPATADASEQCGPATADAAEQCGARSEDEASRAPAPRFVLGEAGCEADADPFPIARRIAPGETRADFFAAFAAAVGAWPPPDAFWPHRARLWRVGSRLYALASEADGASAAAEADGAGAAAASASSKSSRSSSRRAKTGHVVFDLRTRAKTPYGVRRAAARPADAGLALIRAAEAAPVGASERLAGALARALLEVAAARRRDAPWLVWPDPGTLAAEALAEKDAARLLEAAASLHARAEPVPTRAALDELAALLREH